jgi:hypothetical protein
MATAAAAIETESCAAAEAAEGALLPFLVVRAIVDPAEGARPAAAIASLRADGGTRSLALAADLGPGPARSPPCGASRTAGAWRFAGLRQVVRLMPSPPEPAPAAALLLANTPGSEP